MKTLKARTVLFHSAKKKKMPGIQWVPETCQLSWLWRAWSKGKWLLSSLDEFLLKQLQWPKYLGGEEWCEYSHFQVDSQCSFCSRNSLKEPNFVMMSLLLQIFLHNRSKEQWSRYVPLGTSAQRPACIHVNRNSSGWGTGCSVYPFTASVKNQFHSHPSSLEYSILSKDLKRNLISLLFPYPVLGSP